MSNTIFPYFLTIVGLLGVIWTVCGIIAANNKKKANDILENAYVATWIIGVGSLVALFIYLHPNG